MKTVKEEMIRDYKLKKLGYDFMGYTFNNVNELSFHHLIVPKKDSERMGIGDGYVVSYDFFRKRKYVLY